MSDEIVGEIILDINGQTIEDFKSVKELDREIAKRVKLMNKHKRRKVTGELGLDIEYVIPSGEAEFDFANLSGGTLTIDHQDGRRIKYFGVSVLTVGGVNYEEDSDPTRTITVMCTRRDG
jgi:hypothetical protein